MAIRTGVPAAAWLDDTNALVTAVEILEEVDHDG
jgi:hypothetical protein